MRWTPLPFFGSVAMLAAACGSSTSEPPVTDEQLPQTSGHSPVELSATVPPGAQLTGLAITPSGVRYVLDANSGVYRLDTPTAGAAASAALVFNAKDLEERFGLSPTLVFTDITAMDERQLLITAENDGFLLDVEAGTLVSYFCYLPPVEPQTVPISVSQQLQLAGISVAQRTDSVAYSPATGTIFAQPQTWRLDTQEVVGHELFLFPQWGGEPYSVVSFDTMTQPAGAMVATDSGVILGVQHQLISANTLGDQVVLRDFASGNITGMARDVDGSLVLLDGDAQTLTFVTDL